MRTLLTIVLVSFLEVASAQRTGHPVVTSAVLDTMLSKAFELGYDDRSGRVDRIEQTLIVHTIKGLVTHEVNGADRNAALELFKLMRQYGILSISSTGGLDCLWCTLFLLEGEPRKAYLLSYDLCKEKEECTLYGRSKRLKKISPDLILLKLDTHVIDDFNDLPVH